MEQISQSDALRRWVPSQIPPDYYQPGTTAPDDIIRQAQQEMLRRANPRPADSARQPKPASR